MKRKYSIPYGFQFADMPELPTNVGTNATKPGQTDRKDTEDSDD